jgi:hypothetical protein
MGPHLSPHIVRNFVDFFGRVRHAAEEDAVGLPNDPAMVSTATSSSVLCCLVALPPAAIQT